MQNFNLEAVDNVIYGRKKPTIYAFRLKETDKEKLKKAVKVGDTFRPVPVRLDEWRKKYPTLERIALDDEIATASVISNGDEYYFRDYSVHEVLEATEHPKSGVSGESKEFFDNIYFTPNSSETEEDACSKAKSIIEDAISQVKNAYPKEYKFYETIEDSEKDYSKSGNVQNYSLRANQQEAVDKFEKAINSGRTNLLLYAVMRFGKIFTALKCAEKIKKEHKIILILTGKTDTKDEWKNTIKGHVDFKDEYEFYDTDSFKNLTIKDIDETLKTKSAVIYLSLQYLNFNRKSNEKYKLLSDLDIDLTIIDETHFAARAAKLGKILCDDLSEVNTIEDADEYLCNIKTGIKLHLSGTPYRIMMTNEFKEEDIIACVQYKDIINSMQEWYNEHCEGHSRDWENPYFGFPEMIRFAFNPTQKTLDFMKEKQAEGYSFSFAEFLKTDDNKKCENVKFIHEDAVLDLLKAIDGSKVDSNVFPFLDYDKIKEGKMCQHMVMVLPFKSSCDAMEKLLSENKDKFNNLGDYEIVNIAGHRQTYRNVELTKKGIHLCASKNKKTISLTVNRMLTGVTVPEWDTMIYLKDTASAQEYDQAIYRLQSSYTKKYKVIDEDLKVKNSDEEEEKFIIENLKPQTLLVDFSPNRLFTLQEQKAAVLFSYEKDKKDFDGGFKEYLEKEIEISPLFVLNGTSLERATDANIVDAVRNYSANRGVADEAIEIPVQLELINDRDIYDEVNQFSTIDSKEGFKIKSNDTENDSDGKFSSYDDMHEKSEETKKKNAEKPNSKKEDTPEDILRKKFQMYYARILFFAYLMEIEQDKKITSLDDMMEQLHVGRNNEISKNLGLKSDVLNLFKNKVAGRIKIMLNLKIRNIIDLRSEEYDSNVVLKKFSRLSESEVSTPKFVTKQMVEQFPEEIFTEHKTVLDIASKTGEFAIAYCERAKELGIAEEDYKNCIYSIPTSKVAYEFTRKVYNLFHLNTDNIAGQFTSDDLIKNLKDEKKEKKREQEMERIKQLLTQDGIKFCDIKLN